MRTVEEVIKDLKPLNMNAEKVLREWSDTIIERCSECAKATIESSQTSNINKYDMVNKQSILRVKQEL